ncbi:putative membrane protein [[Clostridium] cellulosi]|jgi:stage II sporulation protein D|uniref:Putative membrane protein n=1 Tax=[Clostridium] cellulosi TaxID=29343 RepID=A0A078KR79_9FIRM|nr:MAG: stage II sporulation protein D [[Clostridium] cellulosi]CDZ23670.1 putative membrane protein [[Clostridium] cellulosi]
MKDFIIPVAIFLLLMLLIPMISLINAKKVNNHVNTYASASQTISIKSDNFTFKIKDGKTGNYETVKGFDFICGVVAGEMPASYNVEALKAQAVAALTYCLYQNENGTIVTGLSIAYLTPEEQKKRWSSNYENNKKKIEHAVSEVYGKVLTYDGKIIDAVFFNMSSGITENCKDVFGKELPYLVEVSSPGDTLQEDFISHTALTLDEFKAKVKGFDKDADFSGNPADYLKIEKRSGAGGVISARLCGKEVSGRDIRSIFGLRSANFTLSYKDGTFDFEVKGNGHGVGMSQRGAQYMAQQGKNWREILKWYYKGAEISDYSENLL